MIRNYFKIALRNIKGNKVFSFLNILGLASGILSSLLILLWVADELAIDNYHENNDRLYSVYEKQYSGGDVNAGYYTPGLLYQELKLNIPEIEKTSPMGRPNTKTFNSEDKIFKQRGNFVSEDYFSMFSFRFLEGNADVAINAPDNIVISKTMAESFFGSATNAIGKTLSYENSSQFQVSAVFEEASESKTTKYDYYLHWDVFLKENSWAKDWGNNGPSTFIMLAENADISKIEAKIKGFLKNYNPYINDDFDIELALQPYGEKYLHSNFENGVISGGRIENVRIFSFIAFFILLIACINFMNLASAGSLKRANEVGVRKALGAKKSSLVYQFLGEAILLSLISTVFALVLLALVLPAFNELADKNISLQNLSLFSWLGILGVAILTGLLSGSYPAFLLSSFRAIDIFKNKIQSHFSSKWIREGLVVFQFSLSIILISGMIITSQQISYIQNQSLGFDRQNLLTFTLEGDLAKSFHVFKTKALQLPGIESITLANQDPIVIGNTTTGIHWQGKTDNDATNFTLLAVGADFAKTWGSEMLLGTDFSSSNTSDNTGYIINETALKIMGLENPIGEPIRQWENNGFIIGVMKDFHFNSMKSTVQPLVIRNGENATFGEVLIRITPTNVVQTVESLAALHAELNPAFPFEYRFTDLEYDKLYKSETVFFKLSQYFSIVAIFISCLGLFGLVMFTAQQKVKEIGIRKVLGASVYGITIMLTKNFIKLVLIGIIIGSPIAWYLMKEWLANYEYGIEMPWWAFGVAGILVVGIALFTVSFESIKAANTNPVKNLRTE